MRIFAVESINKILLWGIKAKLFGHGHNIMKKIHFLRTVSSLNNKVTCMYSIRTSMYCKDYSLLNVYTTSAEIKFLFFFFHKIYKYNTQTTSKLK